MKVKVNNVKVNSANPNLKRARFDFGDIQKLADSIKRQGLIQPIVVQQDKEEENKYLLIAGERRFRAVIYLGWIEVPVILKDQLNDLDFKICELEENTCRKDLTWQEQIEITKQLHNLKVQKYGDRKPGDASETGWTLEDTAKSLGVSKTSVSNDIMLSAALEENPELKDEVKKLPKHTARKTISNKLKEKRLQESVKSKKLNLNPSIKLGNCCELIKELDDESIDLWLTDPPFGIKEVADTAKGATYNITKSNVGEEHGMEEVYEKLIPEVYKKLKPGAHIYVFFGHGFYTRLYEYLINAGFIVDQQPVIWSKGRSTVMSVKAHYLASYEAVFFGYKPPQKRILLHDTNNVIEIPSIAPQKKAHPLQKPYELLKIFIENSTSVGETVLDTFSGSGSTTHAAMHLQRKGIGFELDEGNYLNSMEWLHKEMTK